MRGSCGLSWAIANQFCRTVPWTEVEYMTKTDAMLGAEAKEKTWIRMRNKDAGAV